MGGLEDCFCLALSVTGNSSTCAVSWVSRIPCMLRNLQGEQITQSQVLTGKFSIHYTANELKHIRRHCLHRPGLYQSLNNYYRYLEIDWSSFT